MRVAVVGPRWGVLALLAVAAASGVVGCTVNIPAQPGIAPTATANIRAAEPAAAEPKPTAVRPSPEDFRACGLLRIAMANVQGSNLGPDSSHEEYVEAYTQLAFDSHEAASVKSRQEIREALKNLAEVAAKYVDAVSSANGASTQQQLAIRVAITDAGDVCHERYEFED